MSGRPDTAPMFPRRAALARISAWLDRESRALLVTGSMGSGKTVLVNQVRTALATAKHTHAEHYCAAGDATTISVSGLLDSWVTRLRRQLPGYERSLAAIGESPADAFAHTIARPLHRLAEEGRLPPVLLAVDGIEEARDADGRNRILALLAGLTGPSLPPAVKILMTSRPDSGVRVAFDGVERLDLDSFGRDDVAEYVAIRTAHPRLAARLTDQVRGNFLLAAETLDELDRQPRALTGASIPDMPRTLPELYRKRLGHIVDEQDRESLDVLGLLAVARTPLHEAEIATLLGLDRHRARAALDRILPVLAHEPSTGGHRLVHRALAEFLLDPDENAPPVRSAGWFHATIATRMHDDWAGRWESCDEPYAINHTAAHLALAATTAENARQARDARRMLGLLVGDPGFLHAKATAVGVDGLHADLTYAMAVQRDNADVRALDRLLLRQAHHLRGWEPGRLPGFLVQQLHHDAVISGNEPLAEVLSGHLERNGLAHLRLRWVSTPRSRRLIHTLAGHHGAVTAVALAPDGTWAITGAEDATARVWALDTGRVHHTLHGHDGSVTCVTVSPDGTLAATGAEDGTARVWELDTGRLVHLLAGAEDRLTGVAFTADGTHLVTTSVSGDGTRRVWDVTAGKLIDTRAGDGAEIDDAVEATIPGTLVITVSDDGTAHVWDESEVEESLAADAHQGKINAMFLTRDRLITASDDTTARIWDVRTGHLMSTLAGHRDWVASVAVSADGTRAVTASWDGDVLVWELPAGRLLRTLSRHRDHPTAVAVTPDGSRAIIGSWDQTVRVRDMSTGRLVHTLRGHDDWVGAIAVLPGGTRAITASADGTARIWNVTTGELEHVCSGHYGEITALAVTETLAVTASRDGTARVWNLADGGQVHVLAGHEGAVTTVAVADTVAVTGSEDGTAAVWDLRTGEQRHTIEGHRGCVTAVACDAARVVTGSDDRTIQLWRPDGEPLRAGLPDPVTCLAVHHNDLLTVGTAAGGLFAYRLRTTATP